MSKPRSLLPTLGDYLACVVRGQSMAAREAETGVARSTIMRRLRQLGADRANPDVAALVTALERTQPQEVTRETLAAALGIRSREIDQAEELLRSIRTEGPGELLLGDLPGAIARTAAGDARLKREAALACLALGWFAPSRIGPRVRRYTLPGARRRGGPAAMSFADLAVMASRTFTVSAEEMAAARGIEVMVASDHLRPALLRLLDTLPPRTGRVLRFLLFEEASLQAAEAEIGLPPRSAKVLLVDGLAALSGAVGPGGDHGPQADAA